MFESVIRAAGEGDLFARIEVGQLRPNGGIAAQIAPGRVESEFMDRASMRVMPVLFLAGNKDQKAAADALFGICARLGRMGQYPAGTGFEVAAVKTATLPNYVDREQSGGAFIYSCIVELHYYLK